MSYTVKVYVYQENRKVYYHIAEKACWHYSHDMSWSEQDSVHTLAMGGSGSCGMLRFDPEDGQNRFYVVIGVHNWSSWLDVGVNVDSSTTSTDILPKYYNGKSHVREATHKSLTKTDDKNVVVEASFDSGDSRNLVVRIVIK